jgi:hypothetical protein
VVKVLEEAAIFTLRGSNVGCTFDLPDDLWPATVDAGQIGQVVNNIIINAEQSMPEGGLIEVNARNVEIVSPSPIPLGPGASATGPRRWNAIGRRRKRGKPLTPSSWT